MVEVLHEAWLGSGGIALGTGQHLLSTSLNILDDARPTGTFDAADVRLL